LRPTVHFPEESDRAPIATEVTGASSQGDIMHIQVVQDIVCPWCRIGKHNLDAAIATYRQQHGDDVTIEWVPFLLDPVDPGSKQPFKARLAERKGLTEAQVDGMFTRVCEAGQACGIDFNWDKVGVAVDTVPAHQLIALTPAETQAALMDALHVAYFEDGKDIGDPVVLETIAREAGLNDATVAQAREAWASPEARAALMDVIVQVQHAGVTGVPFFIFDGALAASGAQPAEVLLGAMEQAREMPVGAPAS
jgi:predicted DsbA family dithiol-disulfide isomerase